MTSLRKKNGEAVKPAALLRLTGTGLLGIALLMPPGAPSGAAAGPGADGDRHRGRPRTPESYSWPRPACRTPVSAGP